VRQWPAAFARFCYEFVVGDTPELALGVAVIIVGAWLLVRTVGPGTFWCIPLAVVVLMVATLWHAISGAPS